jgi:hypothetical protein
MNQLVMSNRKHDKTGAPDVTANSVF